MAKVVNKPDMKMLNSITGTKPPKNAASTADAAAVKKAADDFMGTNGDSMTEAVSRLAEESPAGATDG